MFMVIRFYKHIYVFSTALARLCKFFGVVNRCMYSAECDGCACRESYSLSEPDGVRVAIDNGIYWSALDGR